MFKKWKLLKKNKYGAYVNGIWMVVILSGSLRLAQRLTDERELDRMACPMSAFLESENSDVPFCTM